MKKLPRYHHRTGSRDSRRKVYDMHGKLHRWEPQNSQLFKEQPSEVCGDPEIRLVKKGVGLGYVTKLVSEATIGHPVQPSNEL